MSQGRPQLVLSVPGERKAQKTQCSMWNIGICWWITTSSQSVGTDWIRSSSWSKLRSYDAATRKAPLPL